MVKFLIEFFEEPLIFQLRRQLNVDQEYNIISPISLNQNRSTMLIQHK